MSMAMPSLQSDASFGMAPMTQLLLEFFVIRSSPFRSHRLQQRQTLVHQGFSNALPL
jgi:hypothetical protein